MYIDFIGTSFDQLLNQAAKLRYVYGGKVSIPMVIRTVAGAGFRAGAEHSQTLYSLYTHVPGLKVVAPSTAYDAKGLLIAAIRDPDPVIFIEHKRLYMRESEVPEEPYIIPFGVAGVVRAGQGRDDRGHPEDGPYGARCGRRAGPGRHRGRGHRPAHARPARPDTILASVRKTGHLVVVDESQPALLARDRHRGPGGVRGVRGPPRTRGHSDGAAHAGAIQPAPGGRVHPAPDRVAAAVREAAAASIPGRVTAGRPPADTAVILTSGRSVMSTVRGWREVLGLAADEDPVAGRRGGLVVARGTGPARLARLSATRELGVPDVFSGSVAGRRVLYACHYGAARTAETVQIAALVGARLAVQIGSCGILTDGVRPGDVVVPTARARPRTGSRATTSTADRVPASERWADQAAEHLTSVASRSIAAQP